MTPRELNLYIVAYAERTKRDGEEGLVTAWLSAYYNRIKRMPDLKKVLADLEPKRQQSDEEMAAEMAKFAAIQKGVN